MIFYIHYILLTGGLSATSVLLGVFFREYSDASQAEIGFLLMSFPFASIVIKPLFCSMADRHQAHKLYLILALTVLLVGYAPFVVIPFFPDFYVQFPRISWYVLVLSCHIGNGGLGVAWSLGDTLAVNMSQRNRTPYSRMRLMGTVSWGVYGYIIGQINELPGFPIFVPAFLILNASVIVEIVILMLWNKEDFVMYDSSHEQVTESTLQGNPKMISDQHQHQLDNFSNVDSTPSSLGGTLRLSAKTAIALRDIIVSDDLTRELRKIEIVQDEENKSKKLKDEFKKVGLASNQQTGKKFDCEKNCSNKSEINTNRNPQILIFRMILIEDGRFIKYLILFTMFGLLLAPMNFVFLSLEDVCKKRDCNFSQLAGSVIISQATIETICFLVLPWFMVRITKLVALEFGLLLLSARYIFYAGYYYTSDISPYWALVGEWGHGISYGIFCTLLADIALMFANQSKLFIPELRKIGFLSDVKDSKMDEAKIQAEEHSIKMALRATMQAVFGGFMDGLGSGIGSLLCGIVSESYSYIKLWQLFTILSVGIGVIYQLAEVSKCRWSDSYKPKKGTKAFEILSMDRDEGNKINSQCKKTDC